MAAGRRPDSTRRGLTSDLLPLGYGLAALLVALLLLPTILRPTPPEQTTSAEFSPDAPPDDDVESIISSLQQAGSRTAGGSADTGSGPAVTTTSVPVETRARACPNGFGDPPRQVESIYATRCAPAWVGDNGGATYQGVTRDEIRIAVGLCPDGGTQMEPSRHGHVSTEPVEDENAGDRTWRHYMHYLNQNFQFYGRRIQFFYVEHGSGDGLSEAAEAESARAAAVQVDEEIGALLGAGCSGPALRELARREVAAFHQGDPQLSEDWYARDDPYVNGWNLTGTESMHIMAAYLCDKLAGRRAEFAGPTEAANRRVFGLIRDDDAGRGSHGYEKLGAAIRDRCGETLFEDAYRWEAGGSNFGAAANRTITQFRSEGVTSIVFIGDPIAPGSYTNAANAQGYYPEWITSGYYQLSDNAIPNLFGYSASQWSHAFGIQPSDMAIPARETDWWKAYKSIDPAGEPHADARFVFRSLLQIANGIQEAGPDLTPETFRRGLLRVGMRASPEPWQASGGYAPGRWSYVQDVAEVWWDQSASGPGALGPGSYRYTNCGARFGRNSVDADTSQLFRSGCLRPPR